MNRRLVLFSSLLLLLWTSVACSTKPAGENAEAPQRHTYSAVSRLPSPQVPLSPCAWLEQWARN